MRSKWKRQEGRGARLHRGGLTFALSSFRLAFPHSPRKCILLNKFSSNELLVSLTISVVIVITVFSIVVIIKMTYCREHSWLRKTRGDRKPNLAWCFCAK